MSYTNRNRAAWNRLAEDKSQFARVATDEQCRQPLLTLDTRGWLPGSVEGLDVLCLASGGGWQSILYAVAGARVTVVDLSPSMLALDESEAQRRGVNVRTVEASMDDLSTLEDASFDIVHQPVSTCYVPDLKPVFAEIARVSRDDALYISQHKQPISLQVTDRDERNRYIIGIECRHKGPLPHSNDQSYREEGAQEYLHTLEDLIGGLCRAGYVVEDIVEPYRGNPQARPGHFRHRGRFVPPYLRIKGRRLPRNAEPKGRGPAIWTP